MEENYNKDAGNKEVSQKIEQIEDFTTLNKIIYQTYTTFSDNYFNCININNLLINYSNSEKDYLKEILNDNFDEVIEFILRKYKAENVLKNEKKTLKNENKIDNNIRFNITNKSKKVKYVKNRNKTDNNILGKYKKKTKLIIEKLDLVLFIKVKFFNIQ